MYVKRQNGWKKHLDFIILDILCLTIAFYAGYICRHGFGGKPPIAEGNSLYTRLLFILLVIHFGVVFFRESYKNIIRRGYLEELKKTVSHCLCVDALALVYLFLIRQTGLYSREALVVFCVLQTGLTYLVRCLRKHCIRVRLMYNPNVEHMLVVTDAAHASQCILELTQKQYQNFRVIGIILRDLERLADIESLDRQSGLCSFDPGEKKKPVYTIGGVPIVAGYYEIYQYLLNHVVDSVFINVDLESPESQSLAGHLVRTGVTVHMNLIRTQRERYHRTVEYIGNYMVVTAGMHIATRRQTFMKRCMDICGGLFGVVLTVIAGFVFGPIIYVQSPGPILFKQTRVGKSGRVFQLYKFRSMYPDAEERKKELLQQNEMEGLMFKMKNDPRIIPIGHFIRKYSIDELPQFFNVLKGEMSLVGTRPPTVDEFEQYSPHHRGRLNSKPGITGLWQVSGRSDITDFEEVVELDTEYIVNWSVSEDIRILWRTVMMVFRGNGAR